MALQGTSGILVPWPGIRPVPPALETWSLNHWITREVLYIHINFYYILSSYGLLEETCMLFSELWVTLATFFFYGIWFKKKKKRTSYGYSVWVFHKQIRQIELATSRKTSNSTCYQWANDSFLAKSGFWKTSICHCDSEVSQWV